MKTARVGKRCAGSVRRRPAAIVRNQRYTPERKAEFLLTNAIDQAAYRRARDQVKKLGLDPDAIPHRRPE